MRQRSTWGQSRMAGTTRKADPYQMNQSHPQPAADEYVIGDPSTFAEDVNTDNRWEDEYKGGQVDRNEIGMPNMRDDTFNHSERVAMDEETLLKKANIAIRTAKKMLPRTASLAAIEDQAASLMHMPDYDLFETFSRLAGEVEEEDDQEQEEQEQAQQQKQAQQEEQEQAKSEQQQKKQAQQQAQQEKEEEQKKQANTRRRAMQEQIAQQIAQAAQQIAQQIMQQQSQVQQQGCSGADCNQQVAQQQAQQVAQQQAQQVAQQQAQQVAQQQQVADMGFDDEIQFEDPDMGMDDDLGIELDAPAMDVGDVQLGPEDEVLRSLFASDEEEQEPAQQQQQQQQKQGHARTASTRTIGTRPTAGVAQIGGSVRSSSKQTEISKLSNLWESAPDVRDVFGIK